MFSISHRSITVVLGLVKVFPTVIINMPNTQNLKPTIIGGAAVKRTSPLESHGMKLSIKVYGQETRQKTRQKTKHIWTGNME